MPSASFFRSCARPFLTLWVALAASTTALLAQTPSAADGFDPNVDGNVYAVATHTDGKVLIAGQFSALQANGSIVVGGAFSSVTGTGASPTARRNIVRLSSTGAVEAYNPNPNGIVLALALHAGGKVVVGGGFTTFQENGAAAATTRNR